MCNLRYDDFRMPPVARCCVPCDRRISCNRCERGDRCERHEYVEPDFCIAKRPVRRIGPCGDVPPCAPKICGCRKPLPRPCEKPCLCENPRPPKNDCRCCMLAVLIAILI